MDALILTPQEAAAILAANPANGNRRIEPRLLDDGTHILNADVLEDPTFADTTKPWRAILNEIPRPTANAKTLEQLDAIDTAARAAKQIEPANLESEI
jgi:hypothetical protein